MIEQQEMVVKETQEVYEQANEARKKIENENKE